MTFADQRAFDLAYTRQVAAELRLKYLLAYIAARLKKEKA